jgi:S1-C subfamily serine protease
VLCGTPAAQAGLFAGTSITSAGGHAVTSPRSLTAILSRCRPGSQVALAWVAPGGSLHTAAVTLAAARRSDRAGTARNRAITRKRQRTHSFAG